MPTKFYPIDARAGLIKRAQGQAAVTATGYVGTQWDQGAAAATDLACVVNVEAIVVTAGCLYTFRLVGSNAADRSDGRVLDTAQLGEAAAVTIETRNSAAGDQIVLLARSEKTETLYRYVDLHLTVAGTGASITFGSYLSVQN